MDAIKKNCIIVKSQGFIIQPLISLNTDPKPPEPCYSHSYLLGVKVNCDEVSPVSCSYIRSELGIQNNEGLNTIYKKNINVVKEALPSNHSELVS